MNHQLPKPQLEVCPSPALLHLANIKESVVVIIDVLRATSTIATALYNGASAVIPVASVAECARIGAEQGALTAGERDGRIAPGLQYGNSPFDFPADLVRDQTIVLTTTNGTRLLHKALDARTIITGSFPNLSSVCEYLIHQNGPVILACAGWKDHINIEDLLFAGAVISRTKGSFCSNRDTTFIAENMYVQYQNDLMQIVKKTSHYHRLGRLGVRKDIDYCFTQDVAPSLPVLEGDRLINKERQGPAHQSLPL